jgi:hypothetical protein
MTQREFESRVKGVPRAARRYLHRGRLRQAARLLFGAALVSVLLANSDGLFSIRSTPVSEKTAQAAGINAFGAARMHTARGIVKHSGIGADSPIKRGTDFDADGFFADALNEAITHMRVIFAAAAVPEIRASADDLVDQAVAAEHALAAFADSLLPSSSDTPAMSLNSNLPMLAGVGAFAALIALCFAAAIFVSTKFSRGLRVRAFRDGARRY